MSEQPNEALLELHYHRALVDSFSSTYGARFLRMLKPSTQQEVWVGFDQGWVHTSVTTQELYRQLSEDIQAERHENPPFHLGYFLQFKVVHQLYRKSRFTPTHFLAPYFRSELSVWPNPNTGLSQHDTLRRLSLMNAAEVYYACPFLFDCDAIYEYPDLGKLQIVDVRTAPDSIVDDDRHFIAFQSINDPTPWWCSDAEEGRGQDASIWINNEETRPRPRTGTEIIEMIEATDNTLSEIRDHHEKTTIFPSSLTILTFRKRTISELKTKRRRIRTARISS